MGEYGRGEDCGIEESERLGLQDQWVHFKSNLEQAMSRVKVNFALASVTKLTPLLYFEILN